MNASIYVYDPTVEDTQSKTRGVGRYMQLLKESAGPQWHFTSDVKSIPYHAVFINPFINFFQSPHHLSRITDRQIAVIHDLIGLKYPKAFPSGLRGRMNIFLNKLTLRHYDLIVTDSQASKNDIVTMLRIHDNRVHVIYPTLPHIFWDAQNTPSPYENIGDFCIYVGDATWNKNLVNIAKAIKKTGVTCLFVGKVFDRVRQVKELGDDAKLLFDNPWEKELKEFFDLTKDDAHFIFTGFIPDKELVRLYSKARLNILMSREEGFGFSFLEAASMGCPSLLADRPVFHEISQDAALFAQPDDVDQIARHISATYKTDVKQTIGKKALERSQFFSQDSFKSSFAGLLYPHTL